MLGTLSRVEIEELLRAQVVARLACHAEGRTYVRPVTYAYDGEGLLIQAGDGLKLRMMRENPWVCVEVDHIDNLANWRSVIAWERFEDLLGGEAPLRAGDGHAAIYRIHLFEKTGRFERR